MELQQECTFVCASAQDAEDKCVYADLFLLQLIQQRKASVSGCGLTDLLVLIKTLFALQVKISNMFGFIHL